MGVIFGKVRTFPVLKMDTNITNKEWSNLMNENKAELVGSKNGNVIGKYAGVMFECIEDNSNSEHSFIWKPLNR